MICSTSQTNPITMDRFILQHLSLHLHILERNFFSGCHGDGNYLQRNTRKMKDNCKFTYFFFIHEVKYCYHEVEYK